MAKATTAILLAAGEGKRMVSKKQKVMHNLCGRPMLGWVMRSVQQHLRLSAERAGQQGGRPQGRHERGKRGYRLCAGDGGKYASYNRPHCGGAGGGRKGLFSLQTHMLFGRRGYADIPGVLL